MSEFNGDVDVVVEDVLEDLVDGVELHGVHGVAQVLLLRRDQVRAPVATAHRTLLLLVSHCLENPNRLAALDAEELLARLAVVTDVLEIKLAIATLLVSTILSGRGFGNEFLDLGLRGEIER